MEKKLFVYDVYVEDDRKNHVYNKVKASSFMAAANEVILLFIKEFGYKGQVRAQMLSMKEIA